MPKPIPLAWSNLTHDRVRFGLFASGIGFAVVLMGVQLGIMNAMLDGNAALADRMTADLILVNPLRSSLMFPNTFPREQLDRAGAHPAVQAVHPVYIEYQVGMLRHAAEDEASRTQTRRVRVVGVDPDGGLFDLPGAGPSDWPRLREPWTALYDRNSRRHPDKPADTVFGPLAPGVTTELAGRDISMVGAFELGFDFSCDGTLIVSEDTFAGRIRELANPTNPLAAIDLGSIRLYPGANTRKAQRDIQALYPDGDVLVLTRAEMVDRERMFWWTNTPIGFAFGAGVVLGFVVGMVICYQILASDVADHMPEYATLKAIGYPNSYLSGVVVQEALILAMAGFLPGMAITALLYAFLSDLTGMTLSLTMGRMGLVLVLTLVMCTVSGSLALRKAKQVDPADVF